MNDLIAKADALLVQLEQRIKTAHSAEQRRYFQQAATHIRSARKLIMLGFGDADPVLQHELSEGILAVKLGEVA